MSVCIKTTVQSASLGQQSRELLLGRPAVARCARRPVTVCAQQQQVIICSQSRKIGALSCRRHQRTGLTSSMFLLAPANLKRRGASVSAHAISLHHVHAGMCECRGLQSLDLASVYRSAPAFGAKQMQLWCAQTSRRSSLGLLTAGAALVTHVRPSDAAYGESANIFGRVANNAGGYACC